MARYAIKSVTATFGGDTFEVKSIPAGRSMTSDPVDVTCLGDTENKYIAGILENTKDIELVVNTRTVPDINARGDLVIALTYTDGAAETSATISIARCILKEITAPNIEAGGDRASNWTLIFAAGDVAPSA